MTDLLKRLHVFKNDVKTSVLDNSINEDMSLSTKNNVVHLRQLDSNITDVYKAINYIEELNGRPYKIINNCLKNNSKTVSRKSYTAIDPHLYTSRIILKDSS
jgi:deoxyadenosine/deoxycytidine kinase